MEARYGIFGWRENGEPLIRMGQSWMTMSRLPKKQQRQIIALAVDESADVVFPTLAGNITYKVKRLG